MDESKAYALGYAKTTLEGIVSDTIRAQKVPQYHHWHRTLTDVRLDAERALRVIDDLTERRTGDSKEHGLLVQHTTEEG